MQDTQEKLVSYLKEKYNPVSIILHGSRTNGMARERSDWDFVILVKQELEIISREILFDANMELKQIVVPVSKDSFLGFFLRSENVNILYDPESIAEDLIKSNDLKVREGNRFQQSDRIKRYAFLSSALDGIADYSDSPLIFFDKKIDFYTRIVESWFRFFKNEFEPSHYYAFPRIQNEDPEFYQLIENFVNTTDSKSLILIGKKILGRLFPDIG
jgi:predicted nucleotidyltransferase